MHIIDVKLPFPGEVKIVAGRNVIIKCHYPTACSGRRSDVFFTHDHLRNAENTTDGFSNMPRGGKVKIRSFNIKTDIACFHFAFFAMPAIWHQSTFCPKLHDSEHESRVRLSRDKKAVHRIRPVSPTIR